MTAPGRQTAEPPESEPTSGVGAATAERRSHARMLFASAKDRVEKVRRLTVPVVLALVPFFWVYDATRRASLTPIGRDQGIFQYIAWAVAWQGEVDYRDVRDVNGPLVHLIHIALMKLGGHEEHRFHVLELAVTGLSFAFVGACIPAIVGRRKPAWLERLAWAAAGWVVLSAQYHLHLYWNQAQRESFCDWFLLPSLALQACAWPRAARATSLRIVAIAALSVVTWFGKPSFVVFTMAQLAMLLVDREPVLRRRARLARFALGGALGALVPVVYVLAYGDLGAFLRVTFVDVPSIYRFIWAKSAAEILGEEGPLTTVAIGLACSALLVGLVAWRELPRRVLPIALGPACGLANVLLQHKGFGYHFHPLTATTQIGFMIVIAAVAARFRASPRRRPLGRLFALGLAAFFAALVATSMKGSPHLKNVWILAGGETPYKRGLPEYFETFKTYDFFPWQIRKGAEYVAQSTSENARVQVYGMDPYILFLARRRSATPYIYAYDLNADAALDGGWSNEPTPFEIARIRAARDEHEADMLARLRASPPEAFVFIDKAPLTTFEDAWEDFRYCCRESAKWVATNYHLAKRLGEVQVWLRDDLP
jgi:hypothetical protein